MNIYSRKTEVFASVVLLIVLLSFIFFNGPNHEIIDPDERPRYAIDPAEQAFYDQKAKEKTYVLRSKSTTLVDSYAGGKVRGNWQAKQFAIPNKVNYGFRMIGSAYDKENDIVYVVSHAGHIWRIDYNELIPTQTQWTSINHSHAFMTTNRKEWFDVFNWKEGEVIKSRMLRSYNNKIEYSDDEGRNWLQSTGVSFQETDNQGCVASSSKGDRALVLAKVGGKKEVAISYDGINYSTCGLDLTSYEYEAKLLKPHHSDNVYVIARKTSSSKLSVYKMTPDSETFTLLHSPTASVGSPTNVIGTYTGGKYHFYYVIGNENYYSADEGATWTKTAVSNYGSTDGNSYVRTVHPDKPYTLFRGYLDVYVSTDKGANFSNWGHKLGWDVHHMRMYERKDGSYMHLVGKDFGVFLSKTPETRDKYFSINNSSPAQMQYDMTVSDNFSTAFSANQDRGAMSFDNSDMPSKTDIRTTDGLRVTLANNEKSIWAWLYFGSIYHTANEGYGSAPVKSVAYADKWVAGSMVAHPDVEKDAIVIAQGGDKLDILSYNEATQAIQVENHSFDFKSYTGQGVTSFGYSPLNSDIWYAAVKDGAFLFSKDGGETFKKSLSGKLAKGNDQAYNYHRNQQVIKASKLDEKRVFFAGVKNAFYISNNNGLTFTTHSDGLDVWRIRDFALSEDEKFVFAACGLSGPWVFSVDDNKWYAMDGPNVPYVDFTSVSYTPSKGMVQFGTYGYGILDFKFDRGNNTLVSPEEFNVTGKTYSAIRLSWNDENAAVNEYIIKRSSDLKTFEAIGTTDVNNYTDEDLDPNSTYYYRVIAKKGDEISLPSDMAFATTNKISLLNSSGWKLLWVSSEANASEGTKAFDKTSTTAWMSQSSAAFPQEIRIDLGQEEDLAAFTYIPTSEGVIKSYTFYASNDTSQWGNPVAEGTWTDENDAAGIVDFTPMKARYVRFVAHSVFSGSQAGIAELQLWPAFDARLDAPVNLSTKAMSSTIIILKWESMSVNADGYIIERKSDGEFAEIDRVASSITSYFDRDLQPFTKYTYRITAYRNDDKSEVSELVSGTTLSSGIISSSAWQVVFKDSEATQHSASYAIDNNTESYWATASTATMPHQLEIDLGKEESISAFSYVPASTGMVKDYELYITKLKGVWGDAVASGSWSSEGRKNVAFDNKEGRYVKFVAKSALDGGNVTSVAELMLWKSYAGTTALVDAKVPTVNIYPVPFSHQLTVSVAENAGYHKVTIINNKGQIIKTQSLFDGKAEMRLSDDLKPGFYYIKLEGRGQSIVRPVLKQ